MVIPGDGLRVTDEVYTFKKWDRCKTNVLIRIDNDTVDLSKIRSTSWDVSGLWVGICDLYCLRPSGCVVVSDVVQSTYYGMYSVGRRRNVGTAISNFERPIPYNQVSIPSMLEIGYSTSIFSCSFVK